MLGEIAVNHDAHPEPIAHQRRQAGCPARRRHSVLGEHLLGRGVEFADVVVAVVEEVADFLERHRVLRRQRRFRGRVRAIGLQFLGGVPQPPVHGNQASADLGHPGDQFLDLGAADRVFGRGGGEDIGQVGDQPGVGIGGEVMRRQVEPLGERKEHRHGDRPLVVFQLVDVAGGQVQRPGQRNLAEAALVSQPPQPGTRKHLRHR